VAAQLQPQISDDGKWYWDGAQWRSLLSPDGRSVWNGSAWVPVAPAQAPTPAADQPSWLPAENWHDVKQRIDDPVGVSAPVEPAEVYMQPGAGRPAPALKLTDVIPLERMAPIALIVIGAIVAGAFAWTHRPQPEPPVILLASHAKLVYHTGDTLRFTVTTDQHGQLTGPNGTPSDDYEKTTAVEAWRVIQVDPDGTTTVGLKFESLTGDIDGQPVGFNAARAKEAILVVKPDGRVTSGGTNGTAGGSPTNSVPASDQFFSVLPDHDVKAGDSWASSWTRPNPLGTGTTTYNTVSSFRGYDALQQFGNCAVIHTVATLPIDMGLNIRALLELTGDDTTGIPDGATVQYKGESEDDMTTYVDMNSNLPVHMLDVSNFTFQMTFQGLPSTPAFAPLQGTFKWAGHQSGSMDLLDLPTPPSPKAA
jgi:hypothetical protein